MSERCVQMTLSDTRDPTDAGELAATVHQAQPDLTFTCKRTIIGKAFDQLSRQASMTVDDSRRLSAFRFHIAKVCT